MKTLPPLKFSIYCIIKAVRHPKTAIAYHYCPDCGVRFPASAKECPKCGDKVGHSPDPKEESPIPWWGSMLCIIMGIICWATLGLHNQVGLAEVGRFLIYAPSGHLFGLSMQK